MYHLGWFLGPGYGLQVWNPAMDGPWTGRNVETWMKPDFYVDLASSLERAGFDFILFVDTNQIDEIYQGNAETSLRLGLWAPKNDPMPLMPLIAQRTKHIGLLPTISSTFYPPYLAARLLTTLDHLTEGRIGYNLVTSIDKHGAQNFGMDDLPPKELRYDMAREWVEIVKGLQTSWDEDAIVADVEKGIFADHTKVHRLDYAGKFHRCRGPLNTAPGPQRSIPMAEAGSSPPGRDLAARHADFMLGAFLTIDEMKAFRLEMRERVQSYGRDPDQFKVLFIVSPILGATDDEARRQADAMSAWRWSKAGQEYGLWFIGHMTGMDLSGVDTAMRGGELNAEFERLGKSQEHISLIAKLFKGQENTPLRDILAQRTQVYDMGLVGSPETVARKMDEMMEEVGGDGFLFYAPTTRHYIAQISDGLAPILQRRGSIRTKYSGRTFKENILAF